MNSQSRINLVEPVQLSYATLLVWLVRAGVAGMSLLFLLYATGWVGAAVRIQDVPDIWTLDALSYAEAVGVAAGWQWVYQLHDGRVLALAGAILFPTSVTIAALAASALFARHRVTVYALISLAEAFVLAIAASGALGRV